MALEVEIEPRTEDEMGWIAGTTHRMTRSGFRLFASPTEVKEPAGFTGNWVTPSRQFLDRLIAAGVKRPIRYRRLTEVLASRSEAARASRQMVREIRLHR